jgi:hypothetical protein
MRMRICTRNQSARIDLHPAIEILRALTELPRFELHLILILSRMCMILCQVAPVHCLRLSATIDGQATTIVQRSPGSHSPQSCQGTLIERYQRRTRRSEILMGLIESDQREAVSVSCA